VRACFSRFFVKFWKIYQTGVLAATDLPVPTFREMRQNLDLLFGGYFGGYGRTLIGFLLFGAMSGFFMFAGKSALSLIFRTKGQVASPISGLDPLERGSLYYILGSLIASLLWFGLGSAGLLNTPLAYVLAIGGCAGFCLDALRSGDGPLKGPGAVKDKSLSWWGQMTVTEKAILAAVLLPVALFSTTAVNPPLHDDTLVTHAALPGFFVAEGRVLINPYHFHSYFPLNTEMLVMWALLLKSEVAAALLMWGFVVSLVSLIGGYLLKQGHGGAVKIRNIGFKDIGIKIIFFCQSFICMAIGTYLRRK